MNGVTHFLPLLSLASVSHLCKEAPSDTALSLWVGLGEGLWALAGALCPLGRLDMPFDMPTRLATWITGSCHLDNRCGLAACSQSAHHSGFARSPSRHGHGQFLFHGAQAPCEPECLLRFHPSEPRRPWGQRRLWPACVP